MRYTKQRDQYSCGPTAILNTLKWAGHSVSWDGDIEWLRGLCEIDEYEPEGAATFVFDDAIQSLSEVRVKKIIHSPSLREIDRELNKGRALIVQYLHEPGRWQYGHYTLCVGKTKKYYMMVNENIKGPALTRIERKSLSKKLKVKRVEPGAYFFSVVWSIEKVDDPIPTIDVHRMNLP